MVKGVASKSGGSESTMKLDWPSSLQAYVSGQIQNSPKMVVLLELICHSVHMGERILVFRLAIGGASLDWGGGLSSGWPLRGLRLGGASPVLLS